MYCKLFSYIFIILGHIVLIVAKCIVNLWNGNGTVRVRIVLIVAKCIVNKEILEIFAITVKVLIVAKCIVNLINLLDFF